jgi:hypothetical protein
MGLVRFAHPINFGDPHLLKSLVPTDVILSVISRSRGQGGKCSSTWAPSWGASEANGHKSCSWVSRKGVMATSTTERKSGYKGATEEDP